MSKSHGQGLLITLIGPAGAGKNRLMEYVMQQTHVRQLPTATTRAIRPGEQEGREHYYLTRPEFEKLIEENKLLEWQIVHQNLYGIVRAPLEAAFERGEIILADIDIFGAKHARNAYPDNVIAVFVTPPSIGVLIERMQDRGDTMAEIGKRLLRVPMEFGYMRDCHHVVVNDEYERSADVMLRIVRGYIETGENSHISDAPPAYHFAYYAEAIPVTGTHFADRVSHAATPAHKMRSSDLPHIVALQGLTEAFGVEADRKALSAGGEMDGDYLPPVALYYNNESHEQVVYRYLYRAESEFDLPEGWSWQPIHLLPNALRAPLKLPGSPINLTENPR